MLPAAGLGLCLILSLVRSSFQGGLKPQLHSGGSSVYQPEYVRGAGAAQPGIPGPLGAKAGGSYPQVPSQGYQQSPSSFQNGYGGLGAKPVKPGYSAPQPSYENVAGLGRFPQSAKRKPGYGNGAGSFPSSLGQKGFSGKPSKAGYGAGSYLNAGAQTGYGAGNYPNPAAQGGYGNGAGNYPSNLPQQGFSGKPSKAGYGAGSYPNSGAQTGYGAGNYPNPAAQGGYGNGAGNYPSNPQQGYGSKPSKAGYGAGNYPNPAAQGGYGNGAGNYPSNLPQQGYGSKPSKAGYGAGNYPQVGSQTGYPVKSSKAGYGAESYPSPVNQGAGYGNGAGNYPSNFPQQAGYGNGAGSYPSNIPQQGLGTKPYKAGVKSAFGAYQGPTGENSKRGALGQFPYKSQSPPADSLGYDPKSVKAGGSQLPYNPQAAFPDPAAAKYAAASQIPYGGEPLSPNAMEEEISPSAPVEGTESVAVGGTAPPITTASPRTPKTKAYKDGYQQLGNRQGSWPYAPEESAHGLNGFYGNGYRGCAGKC
ncbi:glycine rich extracellular protein 1 isoform X4 [Spea bombifrons]|uniref:glycine rich extracellular protein 1 isoform X4 n=1 Tax=Spea bombifrons TaxID=233779 RepID=UPI00234B70CC|nr:glycine rich extracellular protein 1 isoform X4 [Spea bombifrons]